LDWDAGAKYEGSGAKGRVKELEDGMKDAANGWDAKFAGTAWLSGENL
jgi:hypothetical protein